MFIPFKAPKAGQFIRLNVDITNQRCLFKAPHLFSVVYANDEVCELLDRDGNRVRGVVITDIRDGYEEITKFDFENGVHK